MPVDLTSFTLRAQCLDERRPRRSLVAVVRQLVAVQAQAPSSVPRALAARVEKVDAETIGRLHERDGRLVKVWSLRGTLHSIAVTDLPLIHAGVMKGCHAYCRDVLRRRHGLDDRQAERMERAILEVLEDGPKTRKELQAAISACTNRHWGIEIRSVCTRGLAVHAGTKGGEVVFALLKHVAPHAELGDLPYEEARRLLLERYLRGYGPAGVRDFAHWTGSRIGDARRAFEAARRQIVDIGEGLYIHRKDRGKLSKPCSTPPRLLPRFDVYVLSHRDKSRYLAEAHRRRVFRPAAQVEAVILVDGKVAGTWRDRPALRFEPFGRLSASLRKKLAAEYETITR